MVPNSFDATALDSLWVSRSENFASMTDLGFTFDANFLGFSPKKGEMPLRSNSLYLDGSYTIGLNMPIAHLGSEQSEVSAD